MTHTLCGYFLAFAEPWLWHGEQIGRPIESNIFDNMKWLLYYPCTSVVISINGVDKNYVALFRTLWPYGGAVIVVVSTPALNNDSIVGEIGKVWELIAGFDFKKSEYSLKKCIVSSAAFFRVFQRNEIIIGQGSPDSVTGESGHWSNVCKNSPW